MKIYKIEVDGQVAKDLPAVLKKIVGDKMKVETLDGEFTLLYEAFELGHKAMTTSQVVELLKNAAEAVGKSFQIKKVVFESNDVFNDVMKGVLVGGLVLAIPVGILTNLGPHVVFWTMILASGLSHFYLGVTGKIDKNWPFE